MAGLLETPSRVWRRIEAVEGRDMPSLPSLPAFEDSADPQSDSNDEESADSYQDSLGVHSTPAILSSHTIASTIRPPSSASSTARFALSIASRSTKSGLSVSRASVEKQLVEDSFDISSIPSIHYKDEAPGIEGDSLPVVYLPPIEDGIDGELDLSEALQSVSRPNSPDQNVGSIRKKYDYSVSLRSEKKPSPSTYDKLRNVSYRRPVTRTRTPSLTRTTPSPSSSSSHSTPHSNQSLTFQRSDGASPLPGLAIPLPRSTTASPTAGPRSEQGRNYGENSGEPRDHTEDVVHATEDSHHPLDESEVNRDISTEQTNSEREPTFSSEDGPTPHRSEIDGTDQVSYRSPSNFNTAFSSPAPSAMFTPTPAFQPRPRARFNVPISASTPQQIGTPGYLPEDDDDQEGAEGEADETAEDPTTPHAHKRSFLLSVINSTARPRFRYTPHPPRVVAQQTADSVQMTPAPDLNTVLAGVTPRPPMGAARPRFSHPLAQAWAPSESESASGSESPSEPRAALLSPYDPAVERASFISTGSSQDLTTHARANASFDPVMGLGDRGHGVGRFNAGKLNNYLHGLNRKLQEENETLVARLKEYEEKAGKMAQSNTPSVPLAAQGRRFSGGGRRISAGPGIGLGDVAEEAWVEEKAALEELNEELQEQVDRLSSEKNRAEQALAEEQRERARDKERWRERMGEVEKGVEGIVTDLERRLAEAEELARRAEVEKAETLKEAEKRLSAVTVERDVLGERVKKAESALESGQDLGAELNAANERVGQVMGDISNANMHIKELEDEVIKADERLDTLEKELREEKEHSSSLEDEVRNRVAQLQEARKQVADLEKNVSFLQNQLQDSKVYITQVTRDADAAMSRMASLENDLAIAQETIKSMDVQEEEGGTEVQRLRDEAAKSSELARQMEDALEAAETRMLADEQEIAALKAKCSSLERAISKGQEQSKSMSNSSPDALVLELQAEIEGLEDELGDAHKEIARLNMLANQSPARKAIDKAKDARIEALEKEKDDLWERLQAAKSQGRPSGTPMKMGSISGMSPMHRHILAMSLKSPKTPGGPLRDMSWLQSTMNDPTVAPLVAELARLQEELDRANESIDDKLDRLEDAGVGVIGLTKQLEDAKAKTLVLEDEIARLARKEDRRVRRLQRARCRKCQTKVDLPALLAKADLDESSFLDASSINLPSEPPTPPTKTSEALRASLKNVNSQLVTMRKTWDEEKRQLLGEKAVLQDAAKRLNLQVRNAEDAIRRMSETEKAGEKARSDIQEELSKAKRAMDDLEAELATERSRLRALTSDQTRAQREKEQVVLQLRRTESDMADCKAQVQRIKQENSNLEAELRSNTNADQKARLLEKKVQENTATIEQLRQERSLLAADHRTLQQRYSEVSDHVNKLRDQYATSHTSHDKRRHQLDVHLLEIEELRKALSSQAEELQRASSEKEALAAEKNDVARTVASLEADLRRVRRDAEAFGRDLKLLRAQRDRLEEEKKSEKAKIERAQKQSQTQIRLLREELEGKREEARAAKALWKDHVCVADEQHLAAIKLRHNKECKGLIVQIRYLKAKFTRETAMRQDLGYQKQYLLKLLARFERTEQKVLAMIARIGYPNTDPPTLVAKRKSLKSAALSVIFLRRAKRASDLWREQSASRTAITAALQEVRKRRTANGDEDSS